MGLVDWLLGVLGTVLFMIDLSVVELGPEGLLHNVKNFRLDFGDFFSLQTYLRTFFVFLDFSAGNRLKILKSSAGFANSQVYLCT